jgi:lipopolysaccharide transport system permease protein
MNGIAEDAMDQSTIGASSRFETHRFEARHGSVDLPEQPVVSIRPARRWAALNLGDLWAYRELLYFLTWRDVKVRYKQTALGVSWAIIQPLLTMAIFTLFFGRLAHVPSDGIPYPLFAFAGLLPWTFTANAVTAGGNSLVTNSNLISKVYFPRMIIPAGAVGAALVDFGLGFILLIGLMSYYGVRPGAGILMLPVLVLLVTSIAFGLGMLLSALNVKYRDIRHALPFMVQIWMFVTPIIYPASIVPGRWRWLFSLNPLSGVIDGYRACLFGRSLDWTSLSLSAAAAAIILIYAAYTFRSMERTFADIV